MKKSLKLKVKSHLKYVSFFIVGILLLFNSCKKDEDSSQQYNVLFQDSTSWECYIVETDPDTSMYFYMFSLVQDEQLLSGEIYVRDSVTLEEGRITGSVISDSIFFTSEFFNNHLNFSFKGILNYFDNQNHLSGSVESILPDNNSIEELFIIISTSANFDYSALFPDNPYIFRKVNSSSNPGDSSVIFIHGMTGNLTNWDSVITNLTTEFKQKYDVYLFQYNWKDSIMINGRILMDSVIGAGLTNPIIVAHSMGGLVARAYIAEGGGIARLVTLGTPHLGSPLAKLANIISFMNFPGSQDIRPDGEFIQNLLLNTNDIQNRSKYVLFGGQMKGEFKTINTKLKWVWSEDYYDIVDKVGYDAFVLFGSPPNDGLVPISSGFFEGYDVLERKPLLEWVDHKNLRNPTISIEVQNYINSL